MVRHWSKLTKDLTRLRAADEKRRLSAKQFPVMYPFVVFLAAIGVTAFMLIYVNNLFDRALDNQDDADSCR